MTFTRQGDEVTLQMTINDYYSLLFMLGEAFAVELTNSKQGIPWKWIRFVNEMNRTNPDFTP